MSQVGTDIVRYLVSKNLKLVKAFETNRDFQKLLAAIFIAAEKHALRYGTTIDKIGVKRDTLMSRNGRSIRFSLYVKG